jgi:hypothetical protein
MVEFIDYGESRTTKIKRDIKKFLRVHRETGPVSGTPKQRLLARINRYQERNVCGVCVKTPKHSFSHQVREVTERRGALAGYLKFGRLWAQRSLA